MISKGTHIPDDRLKLAADACTAARASFNEWADVPAGKFPIDPIDAMQVQLMRWQRDRFGHVDSSDPVIALGVIEELGETFDDEAEAEDAVDGLGDVMIYGAQLCTANRIAVRHVIGLACLYVRTNLPSPIAIAGRFAHVVGKHAQRTRGLGNREAFQLCLVDALAMMIAKALEDCSLGHDLTIDPGGVFLVIGREVCERKVGDVMIPAPAINVQHVQATDPDAFVEQLTGCAPLDGLTGTQLAEQAALAGVSREMPPRHMMSSHVDEHGTLWVPKPEGAREAFAGIDRQAHPAPLRTGAFDPVTGETDMQRAVREDVEADKADKSRPWANARQLQLETERRTRGKREAAQATLREGVELLEYAETVEGPGDFDVSDAQIPATTPDVTAPK